MKSKKAIESVEVWMWIIAGLIIGSLIFVAGYTLLSHWVHNNEVNQAQQSFSSLVSSLLNVCNLGVDRQEISPYIFPKVVNNITAYNESTDEYGKGNSLCIAIEGEGSYCENLKKLECNLPIFMDAIEIRERKTLFSVVQKALGKPQSAKIRFNITKISSERSIFINWREEIIE
ncbi:hypothetical protein JW930_02780 [Candidatus Woesearchaeota archaeon]|nr:hypothetical protein [Candidatus Woesearchaeota archaeon]